MLVKLVDRSKFPLQPKLDSLCGMIYVFEFDARRLFFFFFFPLYSLFFFLSEKPFLKGGPSSMIPDITDGLETDPGPLSRWLLYFFLLKPCQAQPFFLYTLIH